MGEDQNGHALYSVTFLSPVHVNCLEGVTVSNSPDDMVHAHIFDDLVSAAPQKSFLPYSEWKNSQNKETYWTINPEGGDYFALGDHRQQGNLLPAGLTLFKVTRAAHFAVGSKRMWHWRVDAR